MNLIIREETQADYYASEWIAKRAFWNKHRPGCDEHYLLHKLRGDGAYLRQLSRVAEVDGKVVGLIAYVKAQLKLHERVIPVLSFGPLCVEPDMQAKGIGGALLETTMRLAREQGWGGIVIFGEPDYYPLHGFSPCDRWGVTTADGRNFAAFQGVELRPGGLSYPGARFYEPGVYYDLPKEAVEEYDKRFPYMEKRKLPGQWPDESQ